MKSLYGKYPKRIACECHGEEIRNEDTIAISLNGRCPICNRVHQTSVSKPAVSMAAVSNQAA